MSEENVWDLIIEINSIAKDKGLLTGGEVISLRSCVLNQELGQYLVIVLKTDKRQTSEIFISPNGLDHCKIELDTIVFLRRMLVAINFVKHSWFRQVKGELLKSLEDIAKRLPH